MGIIKLFVQNQCARCPQAKEMGSLLREDGFNVVEFDVGTAEGLAEASYYSVQATPTFILEDLEENPMADFRGEVPPMEKIKEIMARV